MTNTRQVPVTFDATKVVADVIYMPVLVTRDNTPDEMHDPAGANAARSDGGDWRNYQTSVQTNELAREIVSFGHDSVLGAADAQVEVWISGSGWVLSSVSDTTIYVEYGDGSLTDYAFTDPYGRNNVYHSDYEVVAHLKEVASDAANNYINSTGNSYGTGTSMAMANVAAKFGADCAQFDGANDEINFPISPAATDDVFTAQACGNADDLTEDQRLLSIFNSQTASNTESISVIWMDAGGAGDGWRAQAKDALVVTHTIGLDSDNNAAASQWDTLHHRYGTADSELYLNGSSVAAGSGSGNFSDGTQDADFLRIARIWDSTGSANYFNGGIHEARLRWSELSDSWIETEYNNQNDPATFATAGTPVAIGAPPTDIVIFRRRIEQRKAA